MSNKRIVVIGSSNTDMTIKGDRIPAPGETVAGGIFYMGPGGKGANQAVAASRLGGNTTLVCKVGRDLFGDNAIKGYEREGIDTSRILRSDKASGTALILVDSKGENCISVASGANADFTEADVDSVADVLRSADYVLLQLEIPVPSVLRAAKIAHEAGATVILNPAPAAALPEELFRYIDLFIPNRTELSAFSGVEIEGEADILRAAKNMTGKGVHRLIVTLGSEGSLITDGSSCTRIPAKKVEAVDATAAGDTYCGALCVALSEGKSLEDAARFATEASALTVQRAGAQNSIPFRRELEPAPKPSHQGAAKTDNIILATV